MRQTAQRFGVSKTTVSYWVERSRGKRFDRLLREAEVREETIADILWHVRPGMTAHYSVAQCAELVDALNRITDERSRTNRSLAMIAREARGEKSLHKVPTQMKNG